MQSAPLPENELARLAELEQYKILDTPPEEGFDNLARLAAYICGTPIALISLIDADRQWFKAKVGLEIQETPRDIAFCAHAIHESNVFIVPDATQDKRFSDNPLVTAGLKIRFYTGMPLVMPSGHVMGTLCVVDQTPKQLTTEQLNALRMLSRQVVTRLELRLRQRQLEQHVARLNESEQANADILRAIEYGSEGVAFLNKDGCYTYVNKAHAAIYGYQPEELLGQSWKILCTPATIAQIEQYAFPILSHLGHWAGEVHGLSKSGQEVFAEISLVQSEGEESPDRCLISTCRNLTERMATQRRLEANQNSLAQAQALAHVGSWEWDIATGTHVWSDEQFRIFGYAPQAITPTIETFREAMHPDDQARVAQAIEAALMQSQPYQETFRIFRPSGELRYVQARGTVTCHAEGKPTKMTGTVQDITEQRALNQILHDHIQRLDLATKLGGLGISDYDISQNKLVWDQQMHALYGYTADDFPGAYDAWANRLHPEDRAAAEDALHTAIQDGEPFNMEFRVLLPNSIIRHLKASAIVLKDEQNNAVRMIGVHYDITNQKQADAAVRRNSQLMDLSFEPIFVWEMDGAVLEWNRGCSHLYGYSSEEAVGTASHTLLKTEYPSPLAAIEAELEEHGSWSGELRHRTRDGRQVIVESRWQLLVDGTHRLVLETNRDITERKQSEERLKEAAQELASKNIKLLEANEAALSATRAKSEFLATMSHEIRTPMNAIVGMAELLQETPLTPDQANYVGRFSRAAETLMELINTILDLSKIEAGYMALETVPFDLHHLADTIAELMAGKALAKQLELLVLVHPAVPQGVVGDPTRLNQVLVNLVGNAIKFTESGHVMIKIEPASDQSPLHALRFSVSDTGIGIPPEKRQAIFEPFTQVDSTTTRKYGGTGLGLSISQQIVELMGGHLVVDSTPGVGSTFAFVVQLPEAPLLVIKQTGQYLDLHARRLLLVDDNETNLMILREHLARSGVQLVEATNAATALRLLIEAHRCGESFDLAILDYHMPGMNGLELAEAIRARAEFATLPLVMHISDLQRDDTRRAQALGIKSYLYKPLNRKKLMESLAIALNQGPPESAQLESADQSKPLGQPLAKPSAQRPYRILLVEDLEDNRDVIVLLLKQTPYQLEMAENGAVALEKFRTGTYDLVLMDMQMPVMDGLQATAAIRQWEWEQQRRPTPIVALTANAFKEEADKSLAAGCTAHVTKPIKKQTLLAAIDFYASKPTSQAA